MGDQPSNNDNRVSTAYPRRWLGVCVSLTVIALFIVPRAWQGNWIIASRPYSQGVNTALAEAEAWRQGQLHLDGDFYEDARAGDKTYNVTGLSFTILAYVVLTIQGFLTNTTAFPPWLLFTILCILAPIAVSWAFARIEPRHWWAALFAIAFVLGTPMRIVITRGLGGSVYYINHTLAIIGLCIILADVLGPRRWWPAALGLMLAAWSRQMTLLYALPLAYLALCDWRSRTHFNQTAGNDLLSVQTQSSRWRIVITALLLLVIVAVPATLNALKFGSPFDSGYLRLYEGRNDGIAQRAHEALFSPHFIPMHLHAINVAFPMPEIRQGTLHLDLVDVTGGSIWLTAPLTLFVPLTIRRWWPDRRRRAFMLGTLPVIFGLMCYHTTGAEAGYYRYALDFLPVWWLVALPFAGRSAIERRWLVAAAIWGVMYVQWLNW